MKKIVVLVAAMTAAVFSAKAEVEFAYEAGAELVSAYIWRGMYNGGLSFQPEGLVGFNALDEAVQFRAGVWASVGASDWKFKKDGIGIEDVYNPNTYFVPEVDFIASVSAYGASVGFNEYYYCDDGSTHQSEIWFGYNFSHFFGDYAGAYVNWYTTVAGADKVVETDLKRIAKGQLERPAFSSYIELGYDYSFDFGLTLGFQMGLSPWQSPIYGNEKFAVVNLALKANQEWEVGPCTIDLFALGSLNPDGIDKDNVFISAAGDDKVGCQKLNGCIGLGVWF